MKRTVLITGAAQGIGAALAESFAHAGYNVAINCRTAESAESRGSIVLEKCLSAGADAKCFVADVSDFEQSEKLAKEVKEHFGSIDVLINNAGITRDGLIPRMKETDFDDVISSNLKSVFNMCRHVSSIMMRQRSGSIINMSSVVGISGNAGQTNYSASKAGIIGFTKSLAKELGSRSITCNAIAPGFIKSAMTDVLDEKLVDEMLKTIPLKRLGNTDDVAKAALFLASASYVTGQVIVVDGGMAM